MGPLGEPHTSPLPHDPLHHDGHPQHAGSKEEEEENGEREKEDTSHDPLHRSTLPPASPLPSLPPRAEDEEGDLFPSPLSTASPSRPWWATLSASPLHPPPAPASPPSRSGRDLFPTPMPLETKRPIDGEDRAAGRSCSPWSAVAEAKEAEKAEEAALHGPPSPSPLFSLLRFGPPVSSSAMGEEEEKEEEVDVSPSPFTRSPPRASDSYLSATSSTLCRGATCAPPNTPVVPPSPCPLRDAFSGLPPQGEGEEEEEEEPLVSAVACQPPLCPAHFRKRCRSESRCAMGGRDGAEEEKEKDVGPMWDPVATPDPKERATGAPGRFPRSSSSSSSAMSSSASSPSLTEAHLLHSTPRLLNALPTESRSEGPPSPSSFPTASLPPWGDNTASVAHSAASPVRPDHAARDGRSSSRTTPSPLPSPSPCDVGVRPSPPPRKEMESGGNGTSCRREDMRHTDTLPAVGGGNAAVEEAEEVAGPHSSASSASFALTVSETTDPAPMARYLPAAFYDTQEAIARLSASLPSRPCRPSAAPVSPSTFLWTPSLEEHEEILPGGHTDEGVPLALSPPPVLSSLPHWRNLTQKKRKEITFVLDEEAPASPTRHVSPPAEAEEDQRAFDPMAPSYRSSPHPSPPDSLTDEVSYQQATPPFVAEPLGPTRVSERMEVRNGIAFPEGESETWGRWAVEHLDDPPQEEEAKDPQWDAVGKENSATEGLKEEEDTRVMDGAGKRCGGMSFSCVEGLSPHSTWDPNDPPLSPIPPQEEETKEEVPPPPLFPSSWAVDRESMDLLAVPLVGGPPRPLSSPLSHTGTVMPIPCIPSRSVLTYPHDERIGPLPDDVPTREDVACQTSFLALPASGMSFSSAPPLLSAPIASTMASSVVSTTLLASVSNASPTAAPLHSLWDTAASSPLSERDTTIEEEEEEEEVQTPPRAVSPQEGRSTPYPFPVAAPQTDATEDGVPPPSPEIPHSHAVLQEQARVAGSLCDTDGVDPPPHSFVCEGAAPDVLHDFPVPPPPVEIHPHETHDPAVPTMEKAVWQAAPRRASSSSSPLVLLDDMEDPAAQEVLAISPSHSFVLHLSSRSPSRTMEETRPCRGSSSAVESEDRRAWTPPPPSRASLSPPLVSAWMATDSVVLPRKAVLLPCAVGKKEAGVEETEWTTRLLSIDADGPQDTASFSFPLAGERENGEEVEAPLTEPPEPLGAIPIRDAFRLLHDNEKKEEEASQPCGKTERRACRGRHSAVPAGSPRACSEGEERAAPTDESQGRKVGEPEPDGQEENDTAVGMQAIQQKGLSCPPSSPAWVEGERWFPLPKQLALDSHEDEEWGENAGCAVQYHHPVGRVPTQDDANVDHPAWEDEEEEEDEETEEEERHVDPTDGEIWQMSPTERIVLSSPTMTTSETFRSRTSSARPTGKKMVLKRRRKAKMGPCKAVRSRVQGIKVHKKRRTNY